MDWQLKTFFLRGTIYCRPSMLHKCASTFSLKCLPACLLAWFEAYNFEAFIGQLRVTWAWLLCKGNAVTVVKPILCTCLLSIFYSRRETLWNRQQSRQVFLPNDRSLHVRNLSGNHRHTPGIRQSHWKETLRIGRSNHLWDHGKTFGRQQAEEAQERDGTNWPWQSCKDERACGKIRQKSGNVWYPDFLVQFLNSLV